VIYLFNKLAKPLLKIKASNQEEFDAIRTDANTNDYSWYIKKVS
jgi:hypothetical protein